MEELKTGWSTSDAMATRHTNIKPLLEVCCPVTKLDGNQCVRNVKEPTD